jgi:polysaccharide biosynthesis protein PslL
LRLDSLSMMQRIRWLDIIKGIGILLVVAGHIFKLYVKATIFLFHMPLFFFLGGCLFKPSKDYLNYLFRKSVHLLIPYCAFLLVLYSKEAYFLFNDNPISSAHILKIAANLVLGGRLLTMWTGIFWFVTCFFLTQQIFNVLVTTFKKRTVVCIMVIFYVLSLINSFFFRDVFVPWCANVVFAALPFFAFGYYYRSINFGPVSICFSLFLMCIAITLIVNDIPISYDMKFSIYGLPVLTFAMACSVINILVLIAKRINPAGLLGRILTKTGEASMVIMYLHGPVQSTMKNIQLLNNEWLRLFAGVLIPLAAFALFERHAITRVLFLGSNKDFPNLINRIKMAIIQ